MSRKTTKIARPAARKASGRNKPAKSGSRPSRASRASDSPIQMAEPQNPRKRVVDLPKVPGELPTPTATFYF